MGSRVSISCRKGPKPRLYQPQRSSASSWWAWFRPVSNTSRKSRPRSRSTSIAEDRSYRNWAGPGAFLLGAVISIWLFSNQVKYTGPVPKAHPSLGDSTFFVGFAIAAVAYLVLVRVLRPSRPATG